MTPTSEINWLRLEARLEPETLAPGATGRLVVEATVPEGGHIEANRPPEPFLIPTVLEVDADAGISVGPIAYPEPEERRFDWSSIALHVLSGTFRMEAPVEVTAPEGGQAIVARLRYQACTQGACLPPNVQTVVVGIPVRA